MVPITNKEFTIFFPHLCYNVREGKSEHGAKTYAHACMQRMVLLHVNAPANSKKLLEIFILEAFNYVL
mgnify:CR=1 FL=1